MYFVLYPHILRKGFTQENAQFAPEPFGKPCPARVLSFECEIETDPSEYNVFDKSRFQDERAISSIRCSVIINLRTDEKKRDRAFYVPAFSDREINNVKYPDCLEFHIFLNEDGFNAVCLP